jgi:thiol:disulfide interchange protein DsbD
MRRRSTRALINFIFLLLASYQMLPVAAFALGGQDIRPEDVIHWEAVSGRITAPPPGQQNGQISIGLRLRTEQNFTLYHKNLTITGPAGYPIKEIIAPPTSRIMDPIEAEEVDVYLGGDFEIIFEGEGREGWQGDEFPVAVKYVGCTQVICLFPHTVELQVKVFRDVATTPTLTTADSNAASKSSTTATLETDEDDSDLQDRLASKLRAGGFSFGVFLLVVFLGGILSNLTPCVYPMIPITLRLLGRQGHSPYFGATFYALGIVVTYSSLGLVAALSGGLFGQIMASTWFNLVFAVVMALLGISMLGFGDFSKLQSLGNRLGAGKPTAKNYFLMGAGAGLVAAPCTGPILAALLAYTAKNQNVSQSIVLMLSYSFGFALPYLALGGAAAKVSKVKIPPQAQVAVKLIFASVMFALALYYLRVPLYSVTTALKHSWGQIALGGTLLGAFLVIISVYLPNLATNKALQIGPSLILGIGIFGLSQKLTTLGIDETNIRTVWYKSESEAFSAAQSSNKPVLIDMWAEWCEACKKMDATTFQDPRVQEALAADWILLKLDLTESNDTNDAVQERYQLSGLPTLVLLSPKDVITSKEKTENMFPDKQSLTGYQSPSILLNELKIFKKKVTN